MDRNSLIYKIRRKIQFLAYFLIPHSILSKIYYRILLRKKLNLKKPQTLNEKLQWYKLFYCPNDKMIIQCTDKYLVRDFIKSKGYGNLLTKLIGVWNNAEEIDWDKLPQIY